jgi:DNA recombination protein RmuC
MHREVTTREYINPEQNTVDYVLLFIPNEQILSFIHEQDSFILDKGIKNRVIFCSPLTPFRSSGCHQARRRQFCPGEDIQ